MSQACQAQMRHISEDDRAGKRAKVRTRLRCEDAMTRAWRAEDEIASDALIRLMARRKNGNGGILVAGKYLSA